MIYHTTTISTKFKHRLKLNLFRFLASGFRALACNVDVGVFLFCFQPSCTLLPPVLPYEGPAPRIARSAACPLSRASTVLLCSGHVRSYFPPYMSFAHRYFFSPVLCNSKHMFFFFFFHSFPKEIERFDVYPFFRPLH